MAHAPLVVLDTDVWSAIFINQRSRDVAFNAQIQGLRARLVGLTITVSTQTAAEFRAGVLMSNWGERRRGEAMKLFNATPVLPVTEQVVSAYAEITAACKRAGHALHAKQHTGDRWVAATAIAFDAPLCAIDDIYRGAPGLQLIASER